MKLARDPNAPKVNRMSDRDQRLEDGLAAATEKLLRACGLSDESRARQFARQVVADFNESEPSAGSPPREAGATPDNDSLPEVGGVFGRTIADFERSCRPIDQLEKERAALLREVQDLEGQNTTLRDGDWKETALEYQRALDAIAETVGIVGHWGVLASRDPSDPPSIFVSVRNALTELAQFRNAGGDLLGSVPVWHLHESFGRLRYLCRAYRRVALGSSGAFSDPDTAAWSQRMGDAFDFICDEDGRPPCKLHGLRMLRNTIISQYPLASADSTNVAQNHGRERKRYALTAGMAGLVLAHRIEEHAVAPRWTRTFGHQHNAELIG